MDANHEKVSLQPIDSRPEDELWKKSKEPVNGDDSTLTPWEKKSGSCVTEDQVLKRRLVLPNPMWTELKHLAVTNNTTIIDLIRRFVKLGLLVARLEDSGGSLIIQQPGRPDERINVLV